MSTTITYFHIDVNNAFLSWEALYHMRILGETVDLRTLPTAIGGDKAKRHGIILAKSNLAKKCGVTTGEPLVQAYKKCPELIVLAPHHNYYKECSSLFITKLQSYAPIVEQYSIDEAFCDMSGTGTIYGDLLLFAERLRKEIYEELGFSVNIGISSNRLLAKMASDFEKPNKVHTLYPHEIPTKMWPLPARELFFVGASTEKRLSSLGIHTIGDIAHTDLSILRSHLKKQGEIIYNFANGHDLSLIGGHDKPPVGYGNSTTIAFDICDIEDAHHVILSLCESVCQRLRTDNVAATVIALELKDNNFITIHHQRTLATPTNVTDEFYTIACELFAHLWEGSPIRLIGVTASKVTHDMNRQLNLFDMDKYEKLSKLDSSLDEIRHRYGREAVRRASFINKTPGPPNTK